MADDKSFLELIEAWDGVGVVVRHDELTGSWIFIALHDDTLGRPVGGCRMKKYARPEDGLRDAMRLASGRRWTSRVGVASRCSRSRGRSAAETDGAYSADSGDS